jgi:uncharacterized protein (TIGR02145 family)
MKAKVFFSGIFTLSFLFFTESFAQDYTGTRRDVNAFNANKALLQTGNVGVGTLSPPAKFSILGSYGNPTIPGYSSTGILRIGSLINEGIDIGKMDYPTYTGWIQAGFDSEEADPLSLQPLGGNLGIGTTSPHSSAKLDVNSTSQGFLPPRMTQAQRMAIATPAAGLLVYQIDNTAGYYYYTGANWVSIEGSGAGSNSTSTCIDYDGNAYPTFQIGTQVWMAENLRVTHYKNGDVIPEVTDGGAWAALTTGAYCWYENSQLTNAKYGTLYNWHAVNDSRGLCPAGWHAPSDAEWTTLTTYLGGEIFAGGKLKSESALWDSPNTDATNSSGYTGLPGGVRDFGGEFYNVGLYGYWWTSTEYDDDRACSIDLYYFSARVYQHNIIKEDGFSVRCLRD